MRQLVWLFLLVAAGGCAGPAPSQPAGSPPPVAVEVRAVQRRTLQQVVEAAGSVQAVLSTDVVARIPGRVVGVAVDEGGLVTRGQVVVRLDPSDLEEQVRQAQAAVDAARARVLQAVAARQLAADTARHQVQQAQAAVDAARAQAAAAEAQVELAASQRTRAEADLQRVQQLATQGAVPAQQVDAARAAAEAARAQHQAAQAQHQAAQEQLRAAEAALRLAQTASQQVALRQRDVEQAQAALQQAEAALRLARLQLQHTAVRAPISGVVVERRVDPGEYAAPGVPLLTVADTTTVRVQLSVSETQIRAVRVGQPVQVSVDALPGRMFTGRVEGGSPAADARTRSFLVKVRVPNPDGALRPGMFARGRITVASRAGVLAVPEEAVRYEGGRRYVFVVESGVARRRLVQTGLSSDGWVEVQGLPAGTQVVVSGQTLLRDGTPVTVVR
jgi:RND family efflux transporter MFP subunit